MNRGAELLDADPRLAQRLLSQGLQVAFHLDLGLGERRVVFAGVAIAA